MVLFCVIICSIVYVVACGARFFLLGYLVLSSLLTTVFLSVLAFPVLPAYTSCFRTVNP